MELYILDDDLLLGSEVGGLCLKIETLLYK